MGNLVLVGKYATIFKPANSAPESICGEMQTKLKKKAQTKRPTCAFFSGNADFFLNRNIYNISNKITIPLQAVCHAFRYGCFVWPMFDLDLPYDLGASHVAGTGRFSAEAPSGHRAP